MGGSFKVGRIFGVDIGVHWSWIFIFVVVTWSFATGVFEEFYPRWSDAQKWIGGGLVAVVFFLSVLIHELSHAVVSNKSGLPVRSITLFIFGGVANLDRDPDDAWQEFKIAIVGPLSSLLLGVLFAGLGAATYPLNDGGAGVLLEPGACQCLARGLQHAPGFPLDGGRVFRALVWLRNKNRLRATRIATIGGEVVAYGVMALGAIQLVFGSVDGAWMLFIGFFLKSAASSSYEQVVMQSALDGIYVRDVMRTDFEVAAPDVTLEELAHDHVLQKNARCFAVLAAGDLAGIDHAHRHAQGPARDVADDQRVPGDDAGHTTAHRFAT